MHFLSFFLHFPSVQFSFYYNAVFILILSINLFLLCMNLFPEQRMKIVDLNAPPYQCLQIFKTRLFWEKTTITEHQMQSDDMQN